MEENEKPIINLLLESEEYFPFDPKKHNKFHFSIARLVKDEIRSHKWTEGEKGRNLTWEQAVKEWVRQHYDSFVDNIVPSGGARSFIKYHFSQYKK